MTPPDRPTPTDATPAVRPPPATGPVATLGAILKRLDGLADIVADSREKQDQLLRENDKLARAIDHLHVSHGSLRELNQRCLEVVSDYHHLLEQRITAAENDIVGLKRRVGQLDGKGEDAGRPPPDPAAPAK